MYWRRKFTQIWIKFGEIMCQFLYVTQMSITVYMYKHETIRNRLIGYLTYQLIKIWKQLLNNRLFGESAQHLLNVTMIMLDRA